eukprot:2745934-Rhodomonas_salina.2
MNQRDFPRGSLAGLAEGRVRQCPGGAAVALTSRTGQLLQLDWSHRPAVVGALRRDRSAEASQR